MKTNKMEDKDILEACIKINEMLSGKGHSLKDVLDILTAASAHSIYQSSLPDFDIDTSKKYFIMQLEHLIDQYKNYHKGKKIEKSKFPPEQIH